MELCVVSSELHSGIELNINLCRPAGLPLPCCAAQCDRWPENRLPMALPGKSSTCLTDGQWPEHGLSSSHSKVDPASLKWPASCELWAIWHPSSLLFLTRSPIFPCPIGRPDLLKAAVPSSSCSGSLKLVQVHPQTLGRLCFCCCCCYHLRNHWYCWYWYPYVAHCSNHIDA